MRWLHKTAVVLAVMLASPAVPLAAQPYRWDVNVNAGYSLLTGNLLKRSDLDVLAGGFAGGNVSLGNGVTAGTQFGFWFRQRFGVRANFAFTGSRLDGPRSLFADGPLDLIDRDVNFASLTADVLARLKTPRRTWQGFEGLPYIALGLGAQWIRPGGNDFSVVDEFAGLPSTDPGEGPNAVPIRCSATFERCAILRQSTRFAGLAGLGADLRFTPNFGMRLEFGDRIWEAPVKEAVLNRNFPFQFQEVADLGPMVNQLYFTAGFAIRWSLEKPGAHVALRTGSTQFAPPPPPTLEQVTVCVVDPTTLKGLRTIIALRNLQTGDTTVVENGRRVPLADALARVPVAAKTQWFLRGAPLVIGAAPNIVQFIPTGGEQRIEPEQLAYLGTVNGLPVFVEPRSLPPGLGNQGPTNDLNRLIAGSYDAQRALDGIRLIYVPVHAAGCEFQALQKSLAVRKPR